MKINWLENINEGVLQIDQGSIIKWGTSIVDLIPLTVSHHKTEDHVSLNFGNIEITENVMLSMGSTLTPGENKGLSSLKGTFSDKKVAEEIIQQLKKNFGSPRNEDIDVRGIYVDWKIEEINIGIKTGEHHGGSWFIFYIESLQIQ